MATLDDLRVVFDKFCAFGSNRNLTSTSAEYQMDGAKFVKFARDTGITDGKKVTTTDIDIIFNKVKPKTGRKIDFKTFTQAVGLLAELKHPDKQPEDALHQVLYDVCIKSKGPQANGTVAERDSIIARLTDTSQYTGTHAHRFDENGKGRGLEGRDTHSKTDSLHKIVNRDTHRSPVLQRKAKGSNDKLGSSGSIGSSPSSNKGSDSSLNKTKVFDRLTDTSGYTGSHKHRFDADGKGRGLAGR
ncbi:hypothetical protein HDV05_007433 [Chytridiales sp. JEL 0842]|nr:hypothetical protein HDV05_007433 [Chytridiales sp. JEL 0842]